MTRTLAAAVIFVRQGLSFSQLSTSSLSSFDPYFDYKGVNIYNSSSLSFLNVYAPLFAAPQRMAEPPFLPPFFSPPEIFSFWGLQLPSLPLGLKRYFRPPRRGSIQLGHLLFHLNLTLNLCTLFFALSLALLPRLPLLLTFPTALLPGNRLRTMTLI